MIGSSGKGDLQFNDPSGMTSDGNERIFVADERNHRIQCFDCQGNFLFKFGSRGTGDGELKRPLDVSFDSKNQRILVADTGNDRLQVFDVEGTPLFTIGSFGKGDGEFNQPYGIATDQVGNIFISDRENHRVQVFDEEGKFLRKFGSYGIGPGGLKYPIGIGILSNGNVVVAEPGCEGGNQGLSVFSSQGQFVRFIGKDKLKDPLWLFIDSQDNILVAENSSGKESLSVFSKEGKLLKEIGKGVFSNARGVVMNHRGDVFVSGAGKDFKSPVFVF